MVLLYEAAGLRLNFDSLLARICNPCPPAATLELICNPCHIPGLSCWRGFLIRDIYAIFRMYYNNFKLARIANLR
jgi:hypothetical protein